MSTEIGIAIILIGLVLVEIMLLITRTGNNENELFILTWFNRLKESVYNHPALAGSLFTVILILLGMIHNLFFFIPLDISIYNLSILPDFILPGVRQILVLLVVTLVVMILVIWLARVVQVLLFFLRCLILILSYFVQLFLLALVWGPGLFFCVILELLVWLIYKPICYLYRIFRESFTVSYSKNGIIGAVDDKPVEIQKENTSKIFSFIQSFEDILLNLNAGMDYTGGATSKFIEKLAWNHINDKLSKNYGSAPLLLVLIITTSCLTGFKAWKESEYIKNYNVNPVSYCGKPCEKWGVGLGGMYEKWILQLSKVKVRYRTGDTDLQNLLLLGSTTDFVLFWNVVNNQDKSGNPVIVPKNSIAQILSPFQEIDNQAEVEQPKAVVVKPDDNPWINRMNDDHRVLMSEAYFPEKALSQYIAKEMSCSKGHKPHISDFILFKRNDSSVDEEEKEKIGNFIKEYRDSGSSGVMFIFGFASADGGHENNIKLSRFRSRAVANELRRDDISTEIRATGEDHPINGIANGRSAVLGFCKKMG